LANTPAETVLDIQLHHDDLPQIMQRCRHLRRAAGASNDVRSEGFADLVRFIPGDTGVPYDWEYGDHAGKS
jgi:hypothetical protein